MSIGIDKGEGEEASRERNRRKDHQGRRIGGGKELRLASMVEGEKHELGFEGKGGRLALRGEERSGRAARRARMAGAWREVGRRRW